MDGLELGGQNAFDCKYLLQERIGEGGMGVVYRGVEPLIGKQVAIKVLRAGLASDARQVERLLVEARAVNAIRHRGIIDIIGLGNLLDGRHYIVMEYLHGKPLDAFLRQKKVVDAETAIRILDEILAALGAAHRAGVVHRDLKPSNVFLVEQPDGSWYVKLLDFGIAKLTRPHQDAPPTVGGYVIGTPEYMAPEQVRNEPIGPRTDLYALGILAFQMFTGRLPFQGDSAWNLMFSQVEDEPPLPSSLQPGIPPQMDALILQLLSKNPDQRPASSDLVRQVLKGIQKDLYSANTLTVRPLEQPRAPAVSITQELMAAVRRKPVIQLAVTGTGVLVAAGILVALGIALLVPSGSGTPAQHPPLPAIKVKVAEEPDGGTQEEDGGAANRPAVVEPHDGGLLDGGTEDAGMGRVNGSSDGGMPPRSFSKSCIRQGYAFISKNQFSRALEVLPKCCATNPGNADCWDLLGRTYIEQGQPGNGQWCYDKARELRQKQPNASKTP